MPEINELSEREQDILRLVATGASNKEIAHALKISTNTVKVHLRNIFTKIGVSSRTEAAMIAVRQGLVNPQERMISGDIQSSDYQPVHEDMTAQNKWMHIYHSLKSVKLLVWMIILVVIMFGGALIFNLWQNSPINSGVETSLPVKPRWLVHTPLPQARFGLSLVALEDEIYAIGGNTGKEISGRVDKYNPVSDSWVMLSAKPTAVTDTNAVILGGKIYIPGGQIDEQSLTSELEVYDPRQDRWERKAPLPLGISRHSLVSFEGNLYLFGGWDGKKYLDSVYVYDLSQDEWVTKTPMPVALGFASAVVSNGKIFVIGGTNGKEALNTCHSYLPSFENEHVSPWSDCAPLPEGRYGMGATSIADIIQVVGGFTQSGQAPKPVELFPQEERWVVSEGLTVDTPAHFGLVALGTRVYVMGGVLQGEPQDMNISYQAVYTVLMPVIQ